MTELARLGADVTIAATDGSNAGRTPVWIAAQNGHTSTVTELARLGADVTIADRKDRTPVWIATQNGHTSTVTELVRAGRQIESCLRQA